MTSRNITVKVDEEVYRKASIRAAELDTSLSAIVRKFLTDLTVESPQSKSKRIHEFESLWTISDAKPRGTVEPIISSRKNFYNETDAARGLR